MSLRKSPEERAEQQAAKIVAAQKKRDEEALRRTEQKRRAFFASPAGQARQAFERGDHVFQYAINVMQQQAVIVAMVGSNTTKKTTDPVDVLNSVCHEGWELLNGSFVFVEEGQQSRDKFLSSGQNVAVKGAVFGYYLFKRCDDNRRQVGNPWEEEALVQ
jgi:hypothetical protein